MKIWKFEIISLGNWIFPKNFENFSLKTQFNSLGNWIFPKNFELFFPLKVNLIPWGIDFFRNFSNFPTFFQKVCQIFPKNWIFHAIFLKSFKKIEFFMQIWQNFQTIFEKKLQFLTKICQFSKNLTIWQFDNLTIWHLTFDNLTLLTIWHY